jgi:cytochrome P450
MTDNQVIPDLAIRRGCPFAEPDGYDEIRGNGPVSRVRLGSGAESWAVSSYREAREMLASDAFSVDRQHPNFPQLVPGLTGDVGFRASIGEMDPPEHGQARRAINGEFTQRRIEAMRPGIQKMVDELIDAMLAGPKPVDLVTALALPVPTIMICELLGVPDEDRATFQARSATMIDLFTPPPDRMAAIGALLGYIDQLVTDKEDNPTDDLIGRQVQKARANGGVDHKALVELALTLLVAGHESTANMISLGVVALLEHPEQLRLIQREPERMPTAVEELLRYCSLLNPVAYRVVRSDITLGDVLLRAGDSVVALGTSVNRDPEVFQDPDRLDLERTEGRHLAFGYGVHLCIGQHLARAELCIVFETLFRRIPDLRLAVAVEQLSFKSEASAYGLNSLPVTW